MPLFTSSILSTNLSMAPANLSAARHASPATSLAVSRELPSSPPSSSWPAAGGGAKDEAEIRKMSRNVAAEPMISFRARESGLGNVSCHPASLCGSPPRGESNNSTPKLFSLSHTHAFVRVPSDLSRHNPNLPRKKHRAHFIASYSPRLKCRRRRLLLRCFLFRRHPPPFFQ